MKKKALIISMILAAFTAVSLTGCGERVTETEAPQTERVTEAETEPTEVQIETQPVTEIQTESETPVPVTEAPTEAPTENLDNLTPEQEMEREQAYAEGITCYANDAVNVRSTPDTSADNVLTSFEPGDEVYVIAKTPHWYKVAVNDYTGYVSRDYVDNPNEEEPAAVAETAPVVQEEENADAVAVEEAVQAAAASPEVIPAGTTYADSFSIQAASDANVRVSPSENADVFAVVNRGDQLTAIGDSGEWYEVDYNGSIGYIHKNLIG